MGIFDLTTSEGSLRRGECILYQRYFSWEWAPYRIGAHTCTNHTVPYGTALWVGAVPGTSCLATISLSLRAKRPRASHQVSAYGVSLGNPPNRISPEGLTKYGTNRLRTFEPDRMRISSPFREKPLFRLTRGKPYLAGVKLKDVWTLQEPEKRAVLPSSSKRHPSPTPAGSHNPLNRLMLTAESSLRIDPANR
jgi:hypothetical protein